MFILGMMVTMMMQSVMLEKLLYRIPMKNGYFEDERLEDNKIETELVQSI